jgi:heavy metal translocating P-type ATPase
MWCPSCAWLIEEVLRRTAGIAAAKASFVSDRLHLTYFPHIISPDEIAGRVARLGYRLCAAGNSGADQGKQNQIRLAVAAVLVCNIMMASAVFYGLVDVPKAVVRSFSYPVLVMASFVLFYSGLPILKRGFASLFYGTPSMDALISCGALSAYVYSLARMAAGASDLYFDTASMLIVFVLFGRYMETRARQQIKRGTAELDDLCRGKVRSLRGAWKQAGLVRPGERFIVDAGERTPLDSLVVSGHMTVDESFLTGEAAYRAKGPGDRVPGGSAVRDGQATLEATATADESLVGQITAAVKEALERKDAHELLADRFSRLFFPVILAVAAASSLAVWGRGAPVGQAALRGMTVLLVACPCTLGIAIPLVKVASVGLALGFGALVRDPAALERMDGVDTVVFDKTGTLTEGSFSLQEILYKEGDNDALFSWLASVEVHSDHFLGREIVHEARRRGVAIMPAEGFETHEGLGVEGIAEGKKIYIGNRSLMALYGMALEDGLDKEAEAHEGKGNTCVFFAWDGMTRGMLAFGDRVRDKAEETVGLLHERGIEVWLVSGDAESTTGAVARSVGIRHWKGRALPDGKAALIRTQQDRGRRVAMLGDGINDGPGLACADVGCAFGAGADLIGGASDIAFLSPDLAGPLKAIELSRLAREKIRQNLFFAFFYNALAIPVAAAGLLNPLIAVAAMAGSSLTVTWNALRMSRRPISTPLDMFARANLSRL